jgi:hypothetical protein
MKLKYLLWILFLTNLGGISYSQQNAESNSRIVDRLIDEGVTAIRNKLIMLGDENVYVFLFDVNNPEADYIARKVQPGLQGFEVIWGTAFDSADYVLNMVNENIDVRYSNISTDNVLGTKRISRKIGVAMKFLVRASGNPDVIDTVEFSKTHNDHFDFNALASVEDNPAYFMKGALPEESSTSKVLIPALMIGISAAAIILFFTIRSK